MKVSIQGQSASYHDIARRQFYTDPTSPVGRDTFKGVFDDVTSGQTDAGIVAAENSLYGSFNEVYDLLLKHDCWIGGEIYLRIRHCLLAPKGSTISRLKEVHSHPLALAQCEEFLDTKLRHVERFEAFDTAGSAAEIAQRGDPQKAAIASREAAGVYGLVILAEGIETHHENYTRFLVLTQQHKADPAATKTSIVLETANKPGALYEVLGIFADKRLNLSKLESRPIIGQAWHYMFYIDFDAGLANPATQEALRLLNNGGHNVRVLGSYASGLKENGKTT